MRRRLFYIYKWVIGRREATRQGYANWLRTLVDWMQEETGYTLPETPEIDETAAELDDEFFTEEDWLSDTEETKDSTDVKEKEETTPGAPAEEVTDAQPDEKKDGGEGDETA